MEAHNGGRKGKAWGSREDPQASKSKSYACSLSGEITVWSDVTLHIFLAPFAGEITVESEMGVGSTFTVWLPIEQEMVGFGHSVEGKL